ncbi:MAG: hypothetical protein K9K82_05240, partial [Desulfobacteraceae bacterium]|nr:hypothetical protein [Desulfobacteraceae bacterium]
MHHKQDEFINGPIKKWNLFFLVLLISAAAFYSAGCASSTDKTSDNFADKWLKKAEKSRAHSPPAKEGEVTELGEIREDQAETPAPAREKPLPQQKVTLHLRDAPVPAVLRAMAKAADQNILVNETVGGTMSINIENIPWDDAFKGILESEGLTYGWKGDILRIKSMADLKRSLEMSNLQQQVKTRKAAAERAGPMVRQIIKVNYADAEKLSELLTRFLKKNGEKEVQGEIVVDKETNSLVVQASQSDLKRIKRTIRHLDKPRSQILIEANIVEATQETAKELGMRWSGRYVTSSGSLDDFGVAGTPRQP